MEIGGNMKLGDRIKKYENVNRHYALSRMPLIVRVDGRAFHTFTKNFAVSSAQAFSLLFSNCMLAGAVGVIKEMQGFKCAYVQSDEATFLLTDYDSLTCQGWFDYNLSKIISISAATMSVNFNNYLLKDNYDYFTKDNVRLPVFDSRAFNVPIDEVVNTFLWRAKDWHRNSIQMQARSVFSHKQLHKKNHSEILTMLRDSGHDWENLDALYKNGTFITYDSSNKINYHFDIKPTFEDINNLIKPLITF